MLEILRFIFSDVWVWAGAVVMVSVAGGSVACIVRAALGKE